MKALIERLIRGRAVIVGLIVAYTAAGVMALRNLPIEAYPDVTNIQAQVIILWPGHAAEEVEKFVTIPVENQMNSLPQRASPALPRSFISILKDLGHLLTSLRSEPTREIDGENCTTETQRTPSSEE